MSDTITIGTVSITLTDQGCITTYRDGSSYGAHPHDTAHYHVISHRCGYGDDILTYCREHEACHHIVGEWITGQGSKVITALAHGQQPDPSDALLEEVLTQAVQRWLRANERPIIGEVDWDGLKARAAEALNGWGRVESSGAV